MLGIGRAIRRAIRRKGSPQLISALAPLPETALQNALSRVSTRGLEINTVIDIGASDGRWSDVCEISYPNAKYLLVDANTSHVPSLQSYCSKRPNAEYICAAAGAKSGSIYFDGRELWGGVAHDKFVEGVTTEVKQISIDDEVKKRDLPGPYLIKLDTHGYEVPILEGAASTLERSNLVVIETYVFNVGGIGLLFHQMIAHMERLGFRVIDMCDPLWRQKDEALWQIDFFFIRGDRPEFLSSSYS